jgi:hypothetical protein
MALHTAKMTAALASIALLTGLGATIQSASAQNITPPAGVNRSEHHPELRAALRQLKAARLDLQRGAHDFGGERVEALNDVNKAIAEIRKALADDRH